MRFTQLTAHAHGPFGGESLTPAPGLTVVWGLNEAGKSSWHSAALLAITGLSRRRGRPSKGDQETIDRRRPRSGDRWQLEAELHLDDGEDLTVTWDLNQRVAKVLDGLGRDRSNEWMTDGAPDLAQIVGLDRASFVATACVRQSDLQRVREDADVLQELLQRATTSSAADATASAAIAIIDQFRKDQVGLERESSTRPLMEARRRVDATSHELHIAQATHRDRLELLTELTGRRAALADHNHRHQLLSTALAIVDARRRHGHLAEQRTTLDVAAARVQQLTVQVNELHDREQLLVAARHHAEGIDALQAIERQVAETETVRAAAEAAEREHRTLHRHQAWLEHEQARRVAQVSSQRLDRATELQHRHRSPPADPTDVEQLAHHARVVLDRWHERPTLPVLTGPTARQLEERLAVLVDATDGVGRTQTAANLHVAATPSPGAKRRVAGPEEPVRSDRSGRTPATDRAEAAGAAPGRPRALGTEPNPRSDGSAHTDGSVAALAVWAVGALGIGALGLIAGALFHPALFALAGVGVVVGVVGAVVVLRDRSRSSVIASPELQRRLEQAEAAELSTRHAALSAQVEQRRIDEQRTMAVRRALDRLAHGLATVTTAIEADPTAPIEQQAGNIQRWLTEHGERRRELQIAHEEWFELTTLLGDATVADLARDAARDEAHWNDQTAAVHDLGEPPGALESVSGRVLSDRIRLGAAATSDAARQASKLRRQVPDQDPRPASIAARLAVETALLHLHHLAGGTNTERLAACSVDEICTELSTCRQAQVEQKQTRDEAAGQLRQLRTIATSVLPTSAHHRSTSSRSTTEPATSEATMFEAAMFEAATTEVVRPTGRGTGTLAATDTDVAPDITDHQSTATPRTPIVLPTASETGTKAGSGVGTETETRTGDGIGAEATAQAQIEEAAAAAAAVEDDGSDPAEEMTGVVRQLEAEFHALPGTAEIGFTLDRLPSAESLRADLGATADSAAQLHQSIAGLEGRLQERSAPGGLHDPAAAAEHHAAAVAELARVRDLAAVLDETRGLLAAAEDRVHRDIAPRLNAAVNRWLPRIFGDRYTKVLIDPASLDVQVFASGTARRVDLLSQGTTELFYLLLRVALSETLTTAGNESCPLLLDDITVNLDRPRKIAALELLREVATDRQVLVFTQEEEVRTWARANLTGTNALIELPGRVSA